MQSGSKPLSGKDFDDIAQKVRALLEPSSDILIITHVNPDGDAIGSSLALFLALTKMGHRPGVMTPNDFPAFLKWMPGADLITRYDQEKAKATGMIKNASLIICLDFNDAGRMSKATGTVLRSSAFKILVDHHPNPGNFTGMVISDTGKSSTAEIVYELLIRLGKKDLIDHSIATCLYAGMMTDTGCFSYNCSKPRTFEVVAGLLAHEFDKDLVYRLIYDNYSESRMRLLGYCLDRKMEIIPGHRTAIISLSREEQDKFDFRIGDSEGFVNYPLSIGGVDFSALFVEKHGYTKISFRSRGYFDVNTFARKHFHGGGHANASGGEFNGRLEDAVRAFKELLPSYIHELNNG